MYTSGPDDQIEHFVTIKMAADELGIPYFKLQRFIRSGAVPIYRIYNNRRLIRISEVISAIEHSRTGGSHEKSGTEISVAHA